MTVHFIGAGPGAADLLTLRGRDLLARVADDARDFVFVAGPFQSHENTNFAHAGCNLVVNVRSHNTVRYC